MAASCATDIGIWSIYHKMLGIKVVPLQGAVICDDAQGYVCDVIRRRSFESHYHLEARRFGRDLCPTQLTWLWWGDRHLERKRKQKIY